jgi:hypothetical protein
MNKKMAALALGVGVICGSGALILDHNQRQEACQLAINKQRAQAVDASGVDYGKLLDQAGLTHGPNPPEGAVTNSLPFEPSSEFDKRYAAPSNLCAPTDNSDALINSALGGLAIAFCAYWVGLILAKFHRFLER